MREKSKKQLPLMNPTLDHPQAAELERISRILDQEPTIEKNGFVSPRQARQAWFAAPSQQAA